MTRECSPIDQSEDQPGYTSAPEMLITKVPQGKPDPIQP
jgi:hypothetical protein